MTVVLNLAAADAAIARSGMVRTTEAAAAYLLQVTLGAQDASRIPIAKFNTAFLTLGGGSPAIASATLLMVSNVLGKQTPRAPPAPPGAAPGAVGIFANFYEALFAAYSAPDVVPPVGGGAVVPQVALPSAHFAIAAVGAPIANDAALSHVTMNLRFGDVGPYASLLVQAAMARSVVADLTENLGGLFSSSGFSVHNSKHFLAIVELLSVDQAGLDANAWLNLPTWVKYRLTAASTPALCMRAIGAVGNMNVEFFSQDALDAIGAATDAPWDLGLIRAIPVGAVATTHIILTETGMIPKNWYQGKKAISVINPAQRDSIASLVNRTLALAAIPRAVVDAADIAALPALIRQVAVHE